ncbi:MAG TPA: metallophosphoesterase family protein [Candidatus Hydrogenedens sp.]|nr:metallophosphoesterase family protein [Candidatus Hydrogenedens sp.]
MEKTFLTRRDFLSTTCILASMGPLSFIRSTYTDTEPRIDTGSLKGFIISDAHLGWNNPKQPSVEILKENLQNILSAFPDLNLVIDTGDAHHNTAKEENLAEWVQVISEGCGAVPLFYVPGNHEISHNNRENRELRSAHMGSLPCRPYYSFSLRGIHFISLPQMMSANYVSQEALEWVRLDLKAHKDETTLILSHNALKGTTCPGDDTGYRMVANSEEIISLLRDNPQVILWMHGHNHTWEITPRWQKWFVSNGRFGGFPPQEAFGGERIGGIYFEINREGIHIRAWSSSDKKFFDEIDTKYQHLNGSIPTSTSYDINKLPSIAYGVGLSRNGQKTPVYRHYIGKDVQTQVFFMGVDDVWFNENSNLTAYGERPSGGKMLPAIDVIPYGNKKEIQWQWDNPGLLLSLGNGSAGVMTPRRGDAQFAYYPTAPKEKYIAHLRAYAHSAGTEVYIVWRICQSNGTLLLEKQEDISLLEKGYNNVFSKFEVPEFPNVETVHTNENSDLQLLISAESVFRNTGEGVRVEQLQIKMDKAELFTKNPGVIIGGNTYSHNGILKAGEFVELPISTTTNSRFVVKSIAEGNGLVTYLVKETGVEFQVRNATIDKKDNAYHIGLLRSQFGAYKPAIAIAPLVKTEIEPFVKQIQNMQEFRFTSSA